MRKNFWNYYPTTMDEVVLTHSIRGILQDMIDEQCIDNILLFGAPGTGKSSVARSISKNHFLITCDCYEGGLKTLSSASQLSTGSSLFEEGDRILILDNLDRLDERSQEKLSEVIDETPPTTSFIATTQHRYRVIPTLRSRFMQIGLDVEAGNQTVRAQWEKRLAQMYKIRCDKDADAERIEFALGYFPDARQMFYAVCTGLAN
jgi:replication-associated recombination protein RarA